MSKHASSASYSLSGIDHPTHRSGCVSGADSGFGEMKFSLYLFKIVLRVVSLIESGKEFCEWWVYSFVFVYVVELV